MDFVKISTGNTKMGNVPSVSLPAVKTCIKCGCNKKCYARRLAARRSTVAKSYENNLSVLNSNPEVYWTTIKLTLLQSRFFRYHVSGDIPNYEYFEKMISLAKEIPTCTSLCFTKKFSIVNEWISKNGELPSNLKIIFSAWEGLEMVNPFNLPECHIAFRNGFCDAKDGAKYCSGNCAECAITGSGCWTLQKGEQILIKEH